MRYANSTDAYYAELKRVNKREKARRRSNSCDGLLPVVAEEDKNAEEEKIEVIPPELGEMIVMDQYCKKYVGLKLVVEGRDESENDSWSQVSQ